MSAPFEKSITFFPVYRTIIRSIQRSRLRDDPDPCNVDLTGGGCYRPRAVLRSLLVVALAIATIPGGRGKAEAQPGSTPPAAAGPVQETIVHGTVPDLVGRWLALGWIEVPGGGRAINAPVLWEISTEGGKPVMKQRYVSLPPALKSAVEKANEAGQVWKPSPEDLNQLSAAWDSLPAEDPHLAKVTNEISGRDGYDDSLKAEERTKDASWVVRQRQDFDGTTQGVMRQVMIYAVLAPSGRDYTGNFDTATVAAAPFPIPISFQGTFQLYRLEGPASRGFLARVLDVFSGCGRRQPSS